MKVDLAFLSKFIEEVKKGVSSFSIDRTGNHACTCGRFHMGKADFIVGKYSYGSHVDISTSDCSLNLLAITDETGRLIICNEYMFEMQCCKEGIPEGVTTLTKAYRLAEQKCYEEIFLPFYDALKVEDCEIFDSEKRMARRIELGLTANAGIRAEIGELFSEDEYIQMLTGEIDKPEDFVLIRIERKKEDYSEAKIFYEHVNELLKTGSALTFWEREMAQALETARKDNCKFLKATFDAGTEECAISAEMLRYRLAEGHALMVSDFDSMQTGRKAINAYGCGRLFPVDIRELSYRGKVMYQRKEA